METLTEVRIERDALRVERDRLLDEISYLKRNVDAHAKFEAREIRYLRETLERQQDDFIVIEELCALTRMSRRTVDRAKKNRPDFPRPRVISGRQIWSKTEVVNWILKQTV